MSEALQVSNSGPVAMIRALGSEILSRVRWASGYTFDGKRNIQEVLGYKRTLTIEDYRARYLRNAVASRIVEAPAQATWRGGGTVFEDEDPDKETAFEVAWNELNNRLHVWSVLSRADVLAGLGFYSVVLIGAPGDLETPLKRVKTKDIAFLQPYAQDDAQIQAWQEDVHNPRFGQPEMYLLKRTAYRENVSHASRTFFSKRVHWSRIIHIADGLLEDNVFGKPRLERVWNLLDDLEKVTGGGAEAFWRRADQGMQIDVAPDIKLTTENQTKLDEEVEEYLHGLKRVLRTRGVKINSLGSDVANFTGPADGIIAQISAGTGIPQRILMGSERGELASSQDKTNWDDRISDRREEFAEPCVVRQLVDRLIEFGALPEPAQYDVDWPTLKDMNENQRADIAGKWAQLNTAMGEPIVKGNEVRELIGLEPFTDEELKQMAEEAEAQKQKEQQDSLANQEATLALQAKYREPAAPKDDKQTKVEAKIAEEFRAAVRGNDRAKIRDLIANASTEERRALIYELR